MGRRIDIVGNKFGHLTALRFVSVSKSGHSQWEFLCDCGKKIIANGCDVRNGQKTKCGYDCKNHGLAWGEASFNSLFGGLVRNAKRRNVYWNLTREDVIEITSGNCFYCGKQPSQIYNALHRGFYLYNGIDRINNDSGYVVENVVSCCWACNRAKQAMPQDDFRKQVIKIYDHWASKS